MMMNAAVDALRCIISHQNAESRSAFFVGGKKKTHNKFFHLLCPLSTPPDPTPPPQKKNHGGKKKNCQKLSANYARSLLIPYQKRKKV